jgi:hypothetical protein
MRAATMDGQKLVEIAPDNIDASAPGRLNFNWGCGLRGSMGLSTCRRWNTTHQSKETNR